MTMAGHDFPAVCSGFLIMKPIFDDDNRRNSDGKEAAWIGYGYKRLLQDDLKIFLWF